MSNEPSKPALGGVAAWRWPSVIVLVAALGLVAFIYLIKTPERLVETAGKGAVEVAKVLDDAAAKFRRGNITETFVASLPKLESERGGLTRGVGPAVVSSSVLLAERARTTGETQEIGPLNPYARRIVHLAVAEDPTVSSESIGDAFLKTVLISANEPGRGLADR